LLKRSSTELCRPGLNESYSIFGLRAGVDEEVLYEAVQAEAERVVLDLRARLDADVLHKAVQAEAERVVLDLRAGVAEEELREGARQG